MKSWLVCYADAAYQGSCDRLVASAAQYGLDEIRRWGREALEATSFYRQHRRVLDRRRGGGYWLWKPFIIHETLRGMPRGAVLVYCDAGLEIVAGLEPLVDICARQAPQMVFASHYDDFAAPGPVLCGQWTKRDCFAAMDCDQVRYHRAPLLDASCVVLLNSIRTRAFVHEWLRYCSEAAILTDDPNIGGLPNLPEFVAHRHDQSVLSLLAERDRLPRFRHPSQYGNHLKLEAWREAGEWTRYPYGTKGLFSNSPYGTLFNHHRGDLGTLQLMADVRRTVPAARSRVYDAWITPALFTHWRPLGYRLAATQMDVRAGGECRWVATGEGGQRTEVTSRYLEVQPGSRLVHTWPLGDVPTQVSVSFEDADAGTAIAIEHGPFASERARGRHVAIWADLLDIVAAALA